MRRGMKVLAEKYERLEKEQGRVWTGSRKEMYRWFQKQLRLAEKQKRRNLGSRGRSVGTAGRTVFCASGTGEVAAGEMRAGIVVRVKVLLCCRNTQGSGSSPCASARD